MHAKMRQMQRTECPKSVTHIGPRSKLEVQLLAIPKEWLVQGWRSSNYNSNTLGFVYHSKYRLPPEKGTNLFPIHDRSTGDEL